MPLSPRSDDGTAGGHRESRVHGREPIAIIGMGCRFPGAFDVESFWNILAEGRETVGEYPGGRFPYVDEVYSADSPFASRIASRRGGFLPALDKFDAEFFGISPREAALMDPQQRLLLEVGWEAVEDAGLTRERLAGSRTGVFVGVWTSDYEDCLYEASPQVDFHATIGSGRYGASGRLAYFLDLRGPNLTLDTACSSSLVAIHLACQSLLTGECSVALAGGANTILRPEITLVYSDAGMLAPDGRCKFGDASADGYVRSEGAGILVLKRLSNALADGDSIYAVIRGSAVNNDGQSSGLLVSPSRRGQEDVMRSALESAGVVTDDVAYVEAHGTGTLAGDPVEIETIGRLMTTETRRYPCAIGSLKTNIGHTESAAGVAGVMKVALALDRGLVPASLHFRDPSPGIPWNELPVRVPTEATPWPNTERRSIAGVSGFGITGTNAHVVLQGVERDGGRPATKTADRPLLFVLSAQTQEALRDTAAAWIRRIQSDPTWPSSLEDLAYTAAVRRTHLDHRLAASASTRAELVARLTAWLSGAEQSGVVSDRRRSLVSNRAVFVYPGQGGQWLGMGRTLLEREPVFRDAMHRCDAAIAKHVGWSVIDELRAAPNASRLDEIDVVQPTLFAVMIALTELWRSLGVEPSAVVGHSMGEAAAAAVAGALSLDDAAAVICHRSRLMKRVSGQGAMAVVELGLGDARALLEGVEGVWVGASNSATSTVISGDVGAVESLLQTMEAREIFCRRVKVDVASHSGHMDAVRAELEAALADVQPRVGTLAMYSTTSGEVEDGSRLAAEYWGRNLRQPVLFHSAVERLLGGGFDAFVEMNAHPVLTHAISESVESSGRDVVVTGSLRRDADEQLEMISALGTLHVAGHAVDFTRMYPAAACIRMPTYAWQRERHWFEPSAQQTSNHRQRIERAAGAEHAAASSDSAEGVYEAHWVDVAPPMSPSPEEASSRHWIVFANGGVGERIVAELRARGDTCTVVQPGPGTSVDVGADTVGVDPRSDAELANILNRALAKSHGIIHAWSTTPVEYEPQFDELWDAQSLGCLSVGRIVRALAAADTARPTRLWLVTAGCQRVPGDASVAFPVHAPMAGIGRVIAREHPEFRCTNIDIGASPSDVDIQTLVGLVRDGIAEQRIAVRGARKLVARYRRATSSIEPPPIHSDATYLITGGLGGIGRLIARWLVSRGARSLVLVSRRSPSPEASSVIAELEAAGASVQVALADVADRTHVARVLAAAHTNERPLRGVFHLAATVDDRLVANAGDESYLNVMRPKVAGALNLRHALRGVELDFWVSFSSIAAVVGQPGQGPYAAANAFLDGLAQYTSTRGERMHSFEWGPWSGTGLAQKIGTQKSFRAYADSGIPEMRPESGLAILERALTVRAPVVLTAMVDWTQFAAASAGEACAVEFTDLARRDRAIDNRDDAADQIDRLATLPAGQPRAGLLQNHLREQLAAVLKTTSQRLDVHKPMGSMGVDSLMALEFVRRLTRSIGVKVPATAVFNYPTIAKLAAHLETRMEGPERGGSVAGNTRPAAEDPSAVPASVAGSLRDVHSMSDDDALRALMGDS